VPIPDAPHLTDDDDRSLEAIRRQLDEQYPHSTDVTVSTPDARPRPGSGVIAHRVRHAVTTVVALLLFVGVGGAAGLLATRLLLGDPASPTPAPEPAASPPEPAPRAPRAVIGDSQAAPPRAPARPDSRVASPRAPTTPAPTVKMPVRLVAYSRPVRTCCQRLCQTSLRLPPIVQQ